jgi:hypothetical protein
VQAITWYPKDSAFSRAAAIACPLEPTFQIFEVRTNVQFEMEKDRATLTSTLCTLMKTESCSFGVSATLPALQRNEEWVEERSIITQHNIKQCQ